MPPKDSSGRASAAGRLVLFLQLPEGPSEGSMRPHTATARPRSASLGRRLQNCAGQQWKLEIQKVEGYMRLLFEDRWRGRGNACGLQLDPSPAAVLRMGGARECLILEYPQEHEMPATEVSPSLRRRLSDDARQLLRAALGSGGTSPTDTASLDDLRNLSLAQRLQNFRGQIRLEVPTASNAVRLRLVVAETTYILRYNIESVGAEVSIFSKAGAMTSWITTMSGEHVQLRNYVSLPSSPPDVCQEISTLVHILEAMDLFDIFRACLTATPVPTSPGAHRLLNHTAYSTSTDKSSYVFVVDRDTGKPLAVTQTAGPSPVNTESLHLIVEDYLRYEGGIDVPEGIKSDVELLIDTAMRCYSMWSLQGQERMMEMFEIIDRDEDGFISGQDVYAQLLAVGHLEKQCSNIVLEMARLLCDTSDPAEEFGFYKFCGFWVTMLSDTYRVSDPENEATVLSAFERLFLGLKE